MKSHRLGPHSRRHRLAFLDRRTYEAKLVEGFRAELIAHCGGAPNIVQAEIIERCCWVKLRCVLMDSKVNPGQFTQQDSNCYLAWASTLARLMARLDGGSEPEAAGDGLAAIHARLSETAA